MAPQLLVADEPVSSLDASIRGEILALLLNLRETLGLGVLVVTHDLGLAWNIADRIAVMYLGRVVEAGPTEEVLRDPQHPYTRALLSVVPEIDQMEPVVLRGEVPDPTQIPPGCRFHPRCPALADGAAEAAGVADDCRRTALEVLPAGGGHHVACHLVAARTESSQREPPGGAAARAVRRRRRRGRASASGCCSRPGPASAASTTSASTRPAGWPWWTWSVSPSWSRATTTASTRRTTSAGTAAPSWSRANPGSEPVCAAAGALRCPYHSWTYSLAGRLLKAPHTEDGDIDPADFSLHPVGVEEWAGFVFVNLTPGRGAVRRRRGEGRGQPGQLRHGLAGDRADG